MEQVIFRMEESDKEILKQKAFDSGKEFSEYIRFKLNKDETIAEEDLNYLKTKLNLISENQEKEIKELQTQITRLEKFIANEFRDMGKQIGAILFANGSVKIPKSDGVTIPTPEVKETYKNIPVLAYTDFLNYIDDYFLAGDILQMGSATATVEKMDRYKVFLRVVYKGEELVKVWDFEKEDTYKMLKSIKRKI